MPRPRPTERGTTPAPSGTPVEHRARSGPPGLGRVGDTGQGIVIGGSDTGVDGAHPALRRATGAATTPGTTRGTTRRTPIDHNGHGTHTIGSALGRDGIGVAPGAQWMACVNLDRDMGNPALLPGLPAVHAGAVPAGGDAVARRPTGARADVLTNSWGCPALEGCDADALAPAVDALTRGRHLLRRGGRQQRADAVARSTTRPPPYPDVSRSAPSIAKRRSPTSPAGARRAGGATKPDLVAPGVGVLSALPGGGYGALEGTSMATPQVAGVVALMWSAQPELIGDIDTTTQILRDTATPATAMAAKGTLTRPAASCGDANTVGAGLVDAYAAVKAARALR